MTRVKIGFALIIISSLITACGGSSSGNGEEKAPKQSPKVQVSGLQENTSFRVQLNGGEGLLEVNKNGSYTFGKQHELPLGEEFELIVINSSTTNCSFLSSGTEILTSTNPGKTAKITCRDSSGENGNSGNSGNSSAETSDVISIEALLDVDNNEVGVVDFPLKKNSTAFTTIKVEDADLPSAVFVTSRKGNLNISSCNSEDNPIGQDGEVMLDAQGEVCVEIRPQQDAGVDYIRVTYGEEVEEMPVVFDSTMGSELISILPLEDAQGNKVGTTSSPLDSETIALTTITIDNQKNVNTINVTSKKGSLELATCSPNTQPIGSDGDVMLNANNEVCLEVSARSNKGVDAIVVAYADEREELAVVYDASAGIINIQPLVDEQEAVVGTSSSPLRSGVKAKTAIKIENALRASTIKVASEKGKLLLESCDPEMQPMDADGEIPLNDAGEACVFVRTLDESGVDRLIVTYQEVRREQLVVFSVGAVSSNVSIAPLEDANGNVVGVVSAPLNRHVFAQTEVKITDARPSDTVTVSSRKGGLFFESCDPSAQPIGEDGEIMLSEDGKACLYVSIRTGKGVDTLVVDYQGERRELPVVYDASTGSDVIYIDKLKKDGGDVIGVVGAPLEQADVARTTVFIDAEEIGGSVKVIAEKNNIRVESCDPIGNPLSEDGEISLDVNNEVCLSVRSRASAGLDYVVVSYFNKRTQVEEVEKLPVVFWFDEKRFLTEPKLTLLDQGGINDEFGRKSTDSVIPLNTSRDVLDPDHFAIVQLKLTDYNDDPVADAKIIYTVDENIAYLIPPVPYETEENEGEEEVRIGQRSTDLTDGDGVSDWVRIVCLAPGAARLEAIVDGSILDPIYYEFQCGEKQF